MTTYNGTGGNNDINGGNGDDTINGLGGDDDLSGGNGNDDIDGGSGDDDIDGGNGEDEIHGGDGDDTLYGGNGVDTLDGGSGNDRLFGENGNDFLTGGAGDDLIDGNNGFDTVYYSGLIKEYTFLASAGYLHIRHLGGAGPDGHDRVIRVERLVFADRVIDLGSGRNKPVAVDDLVFITEDDGSYNSGAAGVLANDFDFDGDAMSATAGAFVGAYGTLNLASNGTYTYVLSGSAQALALGETGVDSFDYIVSDNDGGTTGKLVFNIAGRNDAPVAYSDSVSTGENDPVSIDVLANDDDVDNAAILTVTAASAPAGRGSASVVGNQVRFDPGSDFESLAAGETEDVLVGYAIADEHGATGGSTVTVTVTGANDGPVANPDAAAGGENEILLIDSTANDTDVDNGAVLTIESASAPAGQGSASAAGDQVRFDPGADFDDLAVGESEIVIVDYVVQDEHGATSSSTVTITVTGANDGPVANPDSRTTSENSAVVIDVLANDDDVDNGAVLIVTAASAPAGQGSVTIVENEVRFDPGTDFDYLASGESAVVLLSYTIEDEYGASASSTVTVTVQGRDEGSSTIGTNDGETLVGTPGDDTIDALGGDDNVFGLAGDDLLLGGDGTDFLSGEEGEDTLEGGNDDDSLSGGEGNDIMSGQAGNDSLSGEDGDDILSGGDGLDTLSGGAGEDIVEGGNDDDLMFGEDGNDQLSGQAGADLLLGGSGDDGLSGGDGNDSLDGGDGDDTLDGGDGEDFLSGGLGANVLTGGLGNDQIVADSTDGVQTIDGGDGNDTIRHSFRTSASVIATGGGSDTIEPLNMDVGAAEIIVTDFTPGAGGDLIRLSGGDGSLLSLLSGWDGSNPFGSGFLRLQQSGSDTLLQWDRDGAAGGSDWETLIVLENTDPDDFTDANFVPGYHPDGSTLTGQTITGTNDGETLTGTFGPDIINALGGDDQVSGSLGADHIDGGDGSDSLYGDSGDDVVLGGNDEDFLFGGDGNDQLSGDAGDDGLFGESGDDALSGGDGNDSLDGGDGDDSLSGGDGQDYLAGGLGTNTLNGGLGSDQIVADSTDGAQTIDGGGDNDSIRLFYRSSASSIVTGSGIDSIELLHADVGGAEIVVTDFMPGAGGDVFRLAGGEGSLLSLLSGWDGSSNPFGAGFLRLQQSGADTLFQWDRDGAGAESDWETLALFQDTDADDFTDANFVPGYHPGGGAPAGETITGTNDADSITGTIGDDTINGLGGDDDVSGAAGADGIDGGDGFDFLNGGGGNDVIEGGNDNDLMLGGDGNDQLFGEAGNDGLFGEAGGDTLTGGDGDDSLDGNDGDDILVGGLGNDYLSGGAGSDVMTGGADADLFDFQSASDGPDEITDFASGSDKIRISEAGFGGGLTPGGPVSIVSGADPTATQASGQFLYDTDDGSLFWDSDGTGSGDAVLVATFTSLPSLVASDFLVI